MVVVGQCVVGFGSRNMPWASKQIRWGRVSGGESARTAHASRALLLLASVALVALQARVHEAAHAHVVANLEL